MSPFAVWREFSPRQLVIIYNLITRASWRERSFQAAIHGADIGKEPQWYFGYAQSGDKAMDELQAYIARKKAQR